MRAAHVLARTWFGLCSGLCFCFGCGPSEASPPSVVLAALSARTPDLVVNLGDLVEPGRLAQLVAPAATLPQWASLPQAEARAIAAQPFDPQLRRTSLLHPSGRSYAALEWELSPGAPLSAERRRRMHVLERAALPQPTAEERLLGGLSRPALAALARGAEAVVDAAYVLLRRGGTSASPRYAVYERERLRVLAAASGLVVRPVWHVDGCGSREAGLCWQRLPPSQAGRWALGVLAAGLLGVVAVLLRQRVRAAQTERAGREHMIRLLAHDLRTPAAGLALSADALRDHLDALPEQGQDALLALLNQTRRLNRVLDTSRRYLTVDGVRAAPVAVEVGAFVVATLESEGVSAEVEVPGPGVTFGMDPQWVALILRNLVANAVGHGAPPVRVAVTAVAGTLELSVSDGGSVGGRSLAELSAPFARGPQSPGLGLGLDLAVRAARQLGGTLHLSGPPTCFTLRLKEDV